MKEPLQRPAREPSPRHHFWCERGVTYMALMLAVVLLGISLTAMAREWKVLLKRDREAELLFRGNRIKTAIEQYAAQYEVMKSSRENRFPKTLEEMTKPPKPTLQQAYNDPITGEDWEFLRVNGEIQGVRSRSRGKPFDQMNFKQAKTYYDILFKAEAAGPCGIQGLNERNSVAGMNTQLPGTTSPFGGMPGGAMSSGGGMFGAGGMPGMGMAGGGMFGGGMPGGGMGPGGQLGQSGQGGCPPASGTSGQSPSQPGTAGTSGAPAKGDTPSTTNEPPPQSTEGLF